jgi:hypothetical protein
MAGGTPTAPLPALRFLELGFRRTVMSLYDMVFGCSHKRLTFPMSVRGKLRRTAAASVTGTYVVCLECGKEFPYDWRAMKLVRTVRQTPQAAEQIPVRAA